MIKNNINFLIQKKKIFVYLITFRLLYGGKVMCLQTK